MARVVFLTIAVILLASGCSSTRYQQTEALHPHCADMSSARNFENWSQFKAKDLGTHAFVSLINPNQNCSVKGVLMFGEKKRDGTYIPLSYMFNEGSKFYYFPSHDGFERRSVTRGEIRDLLLRDLE